MIVIGNKRINDNRCCEEIETLKKRVVELEELNSDLRNRQKRVQNLEKKADFMVKAREENVMAEARFRKIIEKNADGMIVVDEHGRVCFVNAAAEFILGRKYSDFVGGEFGFPLVAGEKTELDIVRKDKRIIVEMRVVEIEWEQSPAYLATIRDITELKKMEQLKADRERQNQVDQFKDDLINTVSHELRTPLATMKEFAEILLDEIPGMLTKDQKEYVNIINGNIDRLSRLIEDLLSMSRIESGKIKLKKRSGDIVRLVEGVVAMIKPMADKKGISLGVSFPFDTFDVYFDEDKIIEVFINLIGNAIKFTPEKGKVIVRIVETPTEVQCSVADTGIGIAFENLDKVFGKFQQVGRMEGAGAKGTGLGLAITKELVKMHRGRLWLESEPGKGSCFSFTIPQKSEREFLKETLSLEFSQTISGGKQWTLVIIEIVNFKALKQEFSQDIFQQLLSSIHNMIFITLHKSEDDLIFMKDNKIAVVVSNKKIDVTIGYIDQLRLLLEKKLFLKKDLESKVEFTLGAATYGKELSNVDSMIEAVKKTSKRLIMPIIGKREIVVVDDDRDFLETIKYALEKMGDFKVLAYFDALEALGAIFRIKPAVIITDIRMPGMNGYELVGRIHEYQGCEDIPVIFLSGNDFEENRLNYNISGRFVKLRKPFEMEELLENIYAM